MFDILAWKTVNRLINYWLIIVSLFQWAGSNLLHHTYHFLCLKYEKTLWKTDQSGRWGVRPVIVSGRAVNCRPVVSCMYQSVAWNLHLWTSTRLLYFEDHTHPHILPHASKGSDYRQADTSNTRRTNTKRHTVYERVWKKQFTESCQRMGGCDYTTLAV